MKGHKPSRKALELVMLSFYRACRLNIFITLHIDDGCMGGGGTIIKSQFDHISFGDETQGNNPHPEYLNFHDDFKDNPNPNQDTFDDSRVDIFYYCVFAHKTWAYVERDGVWSWRDDREGISSGADILISDSDLGNWLEGDADYPTDQAATFMHELGHRLGLSCPCPNECAMSYEDYVGYCSNCWADIDLTLNIG